MAEYTMQLREYIEMWSQFYKNTSQPIPLTTSEKIEIGRTKLFDFDYTIFDESFKKIWETNFIRHFYMREIGFETEALFKFYLETWIDINMPYYNKLFESELLIFDPLTNTKILETIDKTNDLTRGDTKTAGLTSTTTGTNSQDINSSNTTDGTNNKDINSTITDDSFNRTLDSSTPDTRLNITTNDGIGVIEYADKIQEQNENDKRTIISSDDTTTHQLVTDIVSSDATTNATTTGSQTDNLTSSINTIEDYVKNLSGKVGAQSYSKMLTEYRETFLRVEKQMFKEMNELFMLIY